MLSYLLRSITWCNIVVRKFIFFSLSVNFINFSPFYCVSSSTEYWYDTSGIYYTIECIYLCTIMLALINQILGYVYIRREWTQREWTQREWTVFHWSQSKKSDYNKYWFCTAAKHQFIEHWLLIRVQRALCVFFNYKLHNASHLLLHVIVHNVTNVC